MSKRELRQVEEIAEVVGGMLLPVIAATVETGDPGVARDVVDDFLDIDERAAPDGDAGPTELLATLTLVRWLGLAREELSGEPDRVPVILGWIGEHVGKRYRARARYTSGVLESDAAAGEVTQYREALGDDFSASLIWLLAGAVAVYGDGDVGWLERLDGRAPSVTTFLG